MKEIQLSQKQLALVDDEDYLTLIAFKWCVQRTRHHTYVVTGTAKTRKVMHRVIMNPPDGMFVDHVDGNGLNNQKSNLRLATRNQNGYNQKPHKGTSKYKGVSWVERDQVWVSKIRVNGKRIHVGSFKTEEDAAIAYDTKAVELHGEFANTNKGMAHCLPVEA